MSALTHIAFIPIKAESQRCREKCTRPIGPEGMPLWWYTTREAFRAGFFSRVVVIGDSPGLHRGVMEFKPFAPDLFITEKPPTGGGAAGAVLKALDDLGLEAADEICWMLLATSPLRDAQELLAMKVAYEKLDPGQQALITVTGIDGRTLRDRTGPEPMPILGTAPPRAWALSNGAAQVASAAFLRHHRGYHASGFTHGWDIGPLRGLDIDTEEQWRMADALLWREEGGGPDHDD